MKDITREEWLILATEELSKEYFTKPANRLPSNLRVACGIPAGSVKAIGQCWDPQVSKGGTTEIFICPSLDDPFVILSTLLHELVHAVVGVSEGHNANFGRLARKVGLQGKLTATYVTEASPAFPVLQRIATKLPTYPHQSLKKSKKKAKKPVKERVKLVSSQSEDFTFTMLKDVVDQHGFPVDPWGNKMKIKKKKGEEEDCTSDDCLMCNGMKMIACDRCDGIGQIYEDGIDYELEGGSPDDCDQCGNEGEIECPECTSVF